MPWGDGELDVRVTVQSPRGEQPRGDVLFVHGFADRPDNHGPLFDRWNEAGLRVVSFDLPSHGETRGSGTTLDLWTFESLAELTAQVEKTTREDERRPLTLAGWSLGALILARQLQENEAPFTRTPQALALITPAVSVFPLIGEGGFVTTRTLTSNPEPPHAGPLAPRSPLLSPVFAARLLKNTKKVWETGISTHIPVLTLVAGNDEDRYSRSRELVRWAREQQMRHGTPMLTAQCAGAFHEMDNEPGSVGPWVRSATAEFLASGGHAHPTAAPPCQIVP